VPLGDGRPNSALRPGCTRSRGRPDRTQRPCPSDAAARPVWRGRSRQRGKERISRSRPRSRLQSAIWTGPRAGRFQRAQARTDGHRERREWALADRLRPCRDGTAVTSAAPCLGRMRSNLLPIHTNNDSTITSTTRSTGCLPPHVSPERALVGEVLPSPAARLTKDSLHLALRAGRERKRARAADRDRSLVRTLR
jgi:hypothetical protein